MIPARLGRYALGDEVGRGGMSVVYRGHDPVLDRIVALKVLHPHLTGREESRARFSREARAAARLEHPHIVAIHDFADAAEDQAYIVTEFIDGPTLRAFIEAHPITRPEVAALVMLPLFEALAHAHEHGVIHRDVKPENIMFRPDGGPVLMDFGIAQIVDMETLTSTGTILGSPAHMAPEIVDGQPAVEPADIFSAGTVLYWLVCGALPFSGPTPAALFRRILEVRFDPVLQRRPHAGRALARLVEQCLAREPTDRPSSAAEVARTLKGLLEEAGLVDPSQELSDFFTDPEVYQERLGHRVLPVYLTAAQDAWSIKQIPRALDLLDRVLAIDEDHPEAQALLARIERGQRSGTIIRIALAASLFLGLGAGVWALTLDESGLGTPDAGITAITTAQRDAVVAVADATLDARVPDAVVPDAEIPDARIPDARVPDAAPDARTPDATTTVSTMARRRRRPSRRADASVAARLPADASVPVAKIPVEFRVGRWQGAAIKVDGDLKGFGGTLMGRQARGNPLTLPPGRHLVEITVPGCVPFKKTYTLRSGQPRLLVPYNCTLRPATLVVKTANQAERLPVLASNRSGTYRGLTNVPFAIKMSDPETSTRVSVQHKDRQLWSNIVKLRAGGQKSVDYPSGGQP
ncbi:MAG: protein kinase domain-containing protein [Bradymonadia bacterium]